MSTYLPAEECEGCREERGVVGGGEIEEESEGCGEERGVVGEGEIEKECEGCGDERGVELRRRRRLAGKGIVA